MIVRKQLSLSIAGSKAAVRDRLAKVIEETQPDEFIVVSQVYDHAARLRSFELLSEIVRESPADN
ncbi:hypothetical protein [Paenibacillus harenae]|uniref:hypothetical protein n=1 Tax=Paenibacillus harenae TaxID=306543 RepID=UPI000425E08C|nr:hypothetical protein [Paenibacillus harenae]